MGYEGLFFAGLLVVVVILAGRAIANRTGLPDAIPLVLLGLLVSYLPGMERFEVSPEIVLLLFLPPLLYHAASFTSPRETRAESRAIIGLAVGVTTLTALGVAAVIVLVLPEQASWPVAIALGAAVAPTDAVAAGAVLRRVGAPRRIVTILEGESLINDAAALTIFSLALAALTQPLTLGGGLWELLRIVAGGVLWGLVVAAVAGRVRGRIRDPDDQLLISLLVPFIAYIPAENLHLSGVLATVTAGFVLGTRVEGLLPAGVRLNGQTIWQGLVFLLESVLFVLLGLQLHEVLVEVAGRDPVSLVLAAVAAIVTAVAIRLAWEVGVIGAVQRLKLRRSLAPLPLRERVVVGWAGLRGAISLAIALSLPQTVNGRPFEDRPVLIFMAAAVVLATLVGQGMTLPWLLRRLGVGERDDRAWDVARGQRALDEAALARIDELAARGEIGEETAETHRQPIRLRLSRMSAALDSDDPGAAEDAAQHRASAVRLQRELLAAQRGQLEELYRDGRITHDTYRHLQRQLDLDEPRHPDGRR